jgi:hypothetical protein
VQKMSLARLCEFFLLSRVCVNTFSDGEPHPKLTRQVSTETSKVGLDMTSKFASVTDDTEARVRAKTYGLVTLEQMRAAQDLVEVVRPCASMPE